MHSSIFFTLWITLQYNHYVAAEHILTKNNPAGYKYPALILYLPNEEHGTACPASTEREIKFNEEVSVSGKGLFLRNIYCKNETILSGICDKPFEPVMLYDLQTRKYDIGYEVYYEEGKIQLEKSVYFQYRPVDTNNEIINTTKSLSQYVVDSQAGSSTKFHFSDGSPALIFNWIPKLSFTYLAHTKQTKVSEDDILLAEGPSIKCPSHGLSEIDMRVYLSSNDDKNHFELWKDQNAYGALEISQIIPVTLFWEPAEILATCSHMNMVPIWKSIVDGQLKKVDSYLRRVTKTINTHDKHGIDLVWCIDSVTFGVSGVLEEPINKRKMYFSDIKHHHEIAIPKIIYRFIEVNEEHGSSGQETQNYRVSNAVIIIHNDPTHVPVSDRICAKEDEVPGWDDITNDDPRTGFTYVCHYRFKREPLPCIFNSEDFLSTPFRLDDVLHAVPDDPYISVDFDNMDIREFI